MRAPHDLLWRERGRRGRARAPVAHWCRCALASALLATAPAVTALAESRTVDSQAGPLLVEQLAEGLDHPWGMAFLPGGDLLVTERAGRLRILGADEIGRAHV